MKPADIQKPPTYRKAVLSNQGEKTWKQLEDVYKDFQEMMIQAFPEEVRTRG